MVGDLDRDGHDIDVRLSHELLVIREDGGDAECLAGEARGIRAGRAEGPDLVVRQRAQCRDVRGSCPAPRRVDPDDPDAQLRFRPWW